MIRHTRNKITQNKEEKGTINTINIPNAIHSNANPRTLRILNPCFLSLVKYMLKLF